MIETKEQFEAALEDVKTDLAYLADIKLEERVNEIINFLQERAKVEKISVTTLINLKRKFKVEGAGEILAIVRESLENPVINMTVEEWTRKIFDDYKKEYNS